MTIETPYPRKNYFEGLQGLRAFAAIIVMFSHILHEAGNVAETLGQAIPEWMGVRLPYNMGVDIFFVLSGFLMVYTSQKL